MITNQQRGNKNKNFAAFVKSQSSKFNELDDEAKTVKSV